MSGEDLVIKEIDDIIGDIGPLPPVDPVEPAPVEPPVEAAPVEPPVEEAPIEAPPAEPVVAPVIEPVVDTEKVELTSRIEQLMKQVTELSAAATARPTAVAPEATVVEEAIKFVEKDEDLDNILKTPESFNQFMTAVVKRSIEGVYTSLPGMVSQLTTQQVDQKMAIKEFYDNNKDLTAMKPFVAFVANEIASKNPDWPLDKIITELGGEVRGRLQLKAAAEGEQPPPGAPPTGPAFVPGGRGTRPGGGVPAQVSALEKEIMSILD